MSSEQCNSMGEVKPADDTARQVFGEVEDQVYKKLSELRHEDRVHNMHRTDQLEKPRYYELQEYAVETAAYGCNYFGKIKVDEGKFVHARAHKHPDGNVEFYALHTTIDNAIWSRDDPLEYFNN